MPLYVGGEPSVGEHFQLVDFWVAGPRPPRSEEAPGSLICERRARVSGSLGSFALRGRAGGRGLVLHTDMFNRVWNPAPEGLDGVNELTGMTL